MPNRVMIVDHEDACRERLSRHLSDRGFEVLAVDSGESALSSLNRFGPLLVISDIALPGVDGFVLLDRIRRHASGTDVIFITSDNDVQVTIDAMKSGAFDSLLKPLDLERFDGTVDRCLRLHHLAAEGGLPRVRDGDSIRTTRSGPVGCDMRMRDIYKTIGTVAPTATPVLITGETGTGKELIARTIHWNGSFPEEPFVAINCAAVPETLLESELFGHVKGAFTGAASDRKGRFELAGQGTLFLDEIGDTSMAFQAKLLRVLQEREFHPVGGEKTRTTRARIVAATNRDLPARIEEGLFREDLYFRLRVIEITLPPLRERRGDIPLLVEHLLDKVSRDLGGAVPVIPHEVMDAIVAHEWPGNVRELENAITRAALLARGGVIVTEHLGLSSRARASAAVAPDSLDAVESQHIQEVLRKTAGNKSAAARALKISRSRLDRLIDRYDLVV